MVVISLMVMYSLIRKVLDRFSLRCYISYTFDIFT